MATTTSAASKTLFGHLEVLMQSDQDEVARLQEIYYCTDISYSDFIKQYGDTDLVRAIIALR